MISNKSSHKYNPSIVSIYNLSHDHTLSLIDHHDQTLEYQLDHHPPIPDQHELGLLQVDGNLSLSSSTNNSSPQAQPISNHSFFDPQASSSPTLASSDSQTSLNIPGLLDPTHSNSSLSSNSLQNWSDLEHFLPFLVSPTNDPLHDLDSLPSQVSQLT